MMTKTKQLISGLVTAGVLLAMGATANAEYCVVIGPALTVPTFSYASAGSTNSYAYIYVDSTVDGKSVRNYGFTYEDKFVDIANSAKQFNRTIEIRSNNCGALYVGGNGRYYRFLSQLNQIVLK